MVLNYLLMQYKEAVLNTHTVNHTYTVTHLAYYYPTSLYLVSSTKISHTWLIGNVWVECTLCVCRHQETKQFSVLSVYEDLSEWQDKNNSAAFDHCEVGSWLGFAEMCVCVSVCRCVACKELSAVLCGMGVQCASAVSSCSTIVLQTRGERKGKRSDSWGEDEDRDCVRCSAWQRRL